MTVTLSDLIEDALEILYRPASRPLQMRVTADTLTADATDTTLSVDDPSTVHVSDVLEVKQEQLLVTNVSTDALPVITVARGYNGTPICAVDQGDIVLRGPLWSRYRVKKGILRALQRTIPVQIPNLVTETYSATGNSIEMPADTIAVDQVAWFDTQAKAWNQLSAWDYNPRVGPVSSTGQLLSIHSAIQFWRGGTLQVTRRVPYMFTLADTTKTADPGTDETATINLPAAAFDLPSKYAAAYCIGDREVTRVELDTVEEWSQEAAIRNGVNLRLLAQQWNDFYRALDEARRQYPISRPLVYRPRRRF